MITKAGECLHFERCENFRELGGYKTFDGRVVKKGLFYRAPALAAITTSNDISLFNSLKIKHIFDFRSSSERELAPDPDFIGIVNHKIPARLTENGVEQSFDLPSIAKMGDEGINELLSVVAHGYSLLPFENPAYVAMFDKIKLGATPILFHCTAGKDRTGVAAALILILLGVSEQDAICDFLITNTCRVSTVNAVLEKFAPIMQCNNAEPFIRMLTGVSEVNLLSSFSAIKAKYGTFDKYFNAEFAIDKACADKIKNMYLEQE